MECMFHEFRDLHSLFRQHCPDPMEFYDSLRSGMLAYCSPENMAAEMNRALCESKWFENGKPYYKLDNVAMELFSSVNMAIPFKYLVLPYDCFCVRFEDDNPLAVHSMLVSKVADEFGDEQLYLWADLGLDAAGAPELDYIHMRVSDKLIDEAIRELPVNQSTGSDLLQGDRDKALVSIALSVCFLATSSDKMIRPDVLSKDLAKWIDAARRGDKNHCNVIESRAKRRGKHGFVISGERDLLHRYHERGDGHGTGRELSYSHLRGTHFRHYASGLVKLIRQTRVRPDLPLKE